MERQYKDSGIEWIGKIPEEWEVCRFKDLHDKSNVGESIDKEYCTNDPSDTLFYTAGIKPIYTKYNDFPKWKCVDRKDLLLARNGTPYVYLPMPGAVYSDHIIRTPIKSQVIKEYVRYSLQQAITTVVVDTVSIATWSVSVWDKQNIPLPPANEQQRIADFLDKKCGEIDSLIGLQEQMIEKLKAYKQSVITEAVTKGLDPNAKLVPSGIDWIGEIPEGWKINKLFNLCTIKGRVGWKGLRSDEFQEVSYAYLVTGQDFVSSDINWKNCYQIDKERYDEDPYIQLSNGDILVTKDGTIGKIAKVRDMDKPACLNSGIFVLKQRKDTFFQNYLYWYLSSPLLLRYNTFINTGGTTIIHLYQNVFERFSMIVPPLSEQRAIASYLDEKCSDIDHLIAIKQQKIEKLKDYKKSVIYEAVTGKTEINDKS